MTTTSRTLRDLIGSSNFFRVVVVGNIGSGKSTLLPRLEKHVRRSFSSRVVFCDLENVDGWQRDGLLDAHYGSEGGPDASPLVRSAMTTVFQALGPLLDACTRELASRSRLEEAMGAPVVELQERSLSCCTDIFTAAALDSSFDSSRIEASHGRLFRALCDSVDRLASGSLLGGFDAVVYLRASPQLCFDRVRERSRSCESRVSLHDLTVLHGLHDDAVPSMCRRANADLFVVDVGVDESPESVTRRVLQTPASSL